MKSGTYTENELSDVLREEISKFKKNTWLHANFDFMVIPNETSNKIGYVVIDHVVLVDNLTVDTVKETEREISDKEYIEGYKDWASRTKLPFGGGD